MVIGFKVRSALGDRLGLAVIVGIAVAAVLTFTSIVTCDIANTTRIIERKPSHKNTLFNLWTRSKALPSVLSNPHGTDYRSIFVVHGSAMILSLFFGANELIIVAFYAISVLVDFQLSLTAAVKFAFYTKTYYLMLAIPSLQMVAFALIVNMGRYEGWVIIILGIIMADYLKKKWISAGQLPINFSH